MVIVRLDDAERRKEGMRSRLSRSFFCSEDPSAEMFLRGEAADTEDDGCTLTFIMADTSKSSAVGFFSVRREEDGVFRVVHAACADDAPRWLRRTMTSLIREMFGTLGMFSGGCVVRAECEDRHVREWLAEGFTRLSRDREGVNELEIETRSKGFQDAHGLLVAATGGLGEPFPGVVDTLEHAFPGK